VKLSDIRNQIDQVRRAPKPARTNVKVAGRTGAEIKRLSDKAFNDTRYERERYLTATAFVNGDQWVRPDASGKGLVEWSLDRFEGDNHPRVTRNVIGPALRRILARVQTPLVFEVLPKSPDDAARSAARLSSSVCRDVHDRLRFDQLDRALMWGGVCGGAAGVYVLWDPNAGTQLGVDETTGKRFGTGDVSVGVADIGEFAVEPGSRDAATARWWVLRRALPAGEVKDMFGMAEEPSPDATLIPTRAGQRGGGAAQLVEIITLFERPNGKSQGGVWSVVAGEVVEATPWPFPFKHRLNLETFRAEPMPRNWTGRTPAWDAIPVQVEINRARSNLLAHLRDFGAAKLMVDQAFSEDIENGTGVLPVQVDPNMGFKPEFLSPPQLPAWVLTHASEAGRELNEMLGVSDVMAGKAPGSIQSGTALAALIDQSDAGLHPLVRERARVWGRIMSLILELYADKVKAPEKRSLEDNEFGFFSIERQWSGDMLLGHVKATVPEDKVMPHNKAGAVAQAQTLLQAGLVTTAREYAAIAHIPPTAEWLEIQAPDISRAIRENHYMSASITCVVEKFDDHRLHIEMHTAFMKSARWETMTVEEQDLFRQHLDQHEVSAWEAAGELRAQAATDPMLAAAPQVTSVDGQVAEAAGAPLPEPVMGEAEGEASAAGLGPGAVPMM
jgi:hypothetical protein